MKGKKEEGEGEKKRVGSVNTLGELVTNAKL